MQRCKDGIIISKREFMELGSKITVEEMAEMSSLGDNPGATMVVMMQSMAVITKLARMMFESEENVNEGTRN